MGKFTTFMLGALAGAAAIGALGYICTRMDEEKKASTTPDFGDSDNSIKPERDTDAAAEKPDEGDAGAAPAQG